MAGGQSPRNLNKPCILLIVIAGMERFSFKGVASNLVTYLTDVAKMSNSAAAKMVNNWCGITSMLPLLVAPLADSYLDRYTTVLASSSLYFAGLLALTSLALQWPWTSLDKSGFSSSLSWSLHLISLGQAGYNPSLQAFAADQLDDEEELPCTKNDQSSKKKSTFFHWWYFGICCGSLLGVSIMSYIQDTLGWGLGFAIPSIAMIVSIVVFRFGNRFYTHNTDGEIIHIKSLGGHIVKAIRAATSRLTCGEIAVPDTNKSKVVEIELENAPLCQQDSGSTEGTDKKPENGIVEILKVVLPLLPVWTMLLMFAVIFQQPATFFTKQGMTMRRNIGSSFRIPPAALQSSITISIILLMPLYDTCFIPFIRVLTRNEKGITVMQRMGIGMFLSVIAMIIAAVTERKRLDIARNVGTLTSEFEALPMSIFWLLPQYILLGISDIFTVVGMQEFFYSEVPINMRTLGIALYTSVFGCGSFFSSFLITVIEHLTSSIGEKQNWFADDMSRARLDNYYWFLALSSAASFMMFMVFCRFYRSRTVMKKAILVFLVLTLSLISGQEPEKIDTQKAPWRIHTLFSVECQNYFDWQTVGLMHSYRKAQQPGPITRLLSCTEDERKGYRGMELAPTFEVPSMSRHPKTGDWYPAINKPAGVVHWLKYSKEAENVDWVVILDADMIIRGPIVPWEIGAEKGKPVSAYYGYLIGCDNILAKLHTKHPEFCDKVGGLLAMHIDDLRALAPLWLSKTEEVREDRAHWPTNYTGDIYGTGWISEMYGYSFGAAEVGLRHKINDNLMIYPGYTPREGVEPILMHYGLPFNVGNWSFSKLDHHEDDIVYDCSRLFPEPPYPREITQMESDHNKRRALFLNIECINTMNEGLLLQHAAFKCPKPKWSKYLSFLKSKTFAELSRPKHLTPQSRQMMEIEIHEEVNKEPEKPPPKIEVKIHKEVVNEPEKPHPKIHTIFSTECSSYFDWQTVGLVHSFYKSGQPGNITRLLSCTDEDLKQYKGHDLAPTHYVPSMSRHPLTGDWYPAINKPAAVLHWMNHVKTDAEYIVILDADMIMRGPITPWEFNAGRSRPASTPYDYLIGCDNILAKLHTRHPEACDKVGGVIIMHVDDLRKFALQWLHKTMEVRLDRSHWSKNITGDIYESGWISEMYGYSFGAAELNLRHVISDEILIYPGYVPKPGVNYRVFHYGLEYRVGKWSFDKANWRHTDLVNKCWAKFPDPPDPSSLDQTDNNSLQRDLLSVECATTLNEALRLHHERRKCPDPNTISTPKHDRVNQDRVDETRTNAETRRASAETRTNAETRTSAESRTNADTKTDAETRTNSETRADDEIRTNAEARMAVETTTSTKFGGVDEVQAFRHDEMPKNSSQESSQVETSNGTFTSMRFWIMVLWGVSIFGFLGVMSVMLKGRKGLKKRGKGYKSKRRTTYSGFWDTNGQDRHLRNAETA